MCARLWTKIQDPGSMSSTRTRLTRERHLEATSLHQAGDTHMDPTTSPCPALLCAVWKAGVTHVRHLTACSPQGKKQRRVHPRSLPTVPCSNSSIQSNLLIFCYINELTSLLVFIIIIIIIKRRSGINPIPPTVIDRD